MRFGKFIHESWDDDALVDQFFNDLRRLQRHIQGTEKLPTAPKADIRYPDDSQARSIFIMKNEKIGPVCLPLKTGTTNWQKALGAVYLNQMDPSVVIDSAELHTTDGFHLVPRYFQMYNILAGPKQVKGMGLYISRPASSVGRALDS